MPPDPPPGRVLPSQTFSSLQIQSQGASLLSHTVLNQCAAARGKNTVSQLDYVLPRGLTGCVSGDTSSHHRRVAWQIQ